MELVKICNGEYTKFSDLKNGIRYATNPEKSNGFIGGLGVSPFSPQDMIFQMQMVKRSFGKEENGRRQLRHIIISFKADWEVSPELALRIAYEVADFYAGQYQICFGVHQDTNNIHIHFIQNTVSHINGKMFSGAWEELAKFKAYTMDILGKYIPQCSNKISLDEFLQDG